jgi:PHD/YefM family antitoxin component YafN of YafNO toxin-antitoxin module
MAQNETMKIGVRQFRDNFASYVGSTDQPIAITRHQDIVGYYIPARPRRTEDEKTALRQAVAKLHEVLHENGISPEEVFEELKSARAKDAAPEVEKIRPAQVRGA